MKRQLITAGLISSLSMAGLTGCENLPGNGKEQGAVIGGAGGAAAGAAVAKDHRLAGAVIGGLLGAGGGWLIGQQVDKKHNPQDADRAAQAAQQSPATPEQARQSATADLNKDGFVTLDEVVAMRDAGLNDQEMIRRLKATGQVFELTSSQEDYLINKGVSRNVVDRMRTMNQSTTAQPAASTTYPPTNIGNEPISQPR